jgi:hypothetical protein
MTEPQRLSRRRFLGTAAAGSLAVAGLGVLAPKALSGASANGVGEQLVPPGKLSIQHFSIRDSITRRSIANSLANGLTPTMGYLGGPNFPEDPTDLGPLMPLPGGFQEVFEFLAGLGFRGFEFFQFTQNVNELGRQPTHAEIRSYLDAAGLTSTGTHTGGLGAMYDPVTGGLSANGQLQIQIAQTLGHTMIGTAGDPTSLATLGDRLNPNGTITIGWTEAARRANVVGGILAGLGMRWYWHTEQNGWQFFNDPDHPELSRTHRIDWWTANTDPSLVFFEPDIFHSYSGRARFPDPVDGSKWDAFGFWQANTHRLVGWHVKDGTRLAVQPAPPANPFTQTIVRPPTFAPGGLANNDALYTGEGTIGKGYPFDPDPAVVGFKKIFDDVGNKGAKFSILETDSGIGPATDPGRSLRHAKLGSEYLFGLRAGPSTHASRGVEDETVFESDLELTG